MFRCLPTINIISVLELAFRALNSRSGLMVSTPSLGGVKGPGRQALSLPHVKPVYLSIIVRKPPNQRSFFFVE